MKKKKNPSITTTSVISLAEFNQLHTNVCEIINKHIHLLEIDDTLKQLFPRYSINIVNERRRKFSMQLTLTTSKVIYYT